MKIVVNGEAIETVALTLAMLLDECGLSGRVATAVNEQFVPVSLRDDYQLQEGDRVEVVAPMQGG